MIKTNRTFNNLNYKFFCLFALALLISIFTSCHENKSLEIGGFTFGSSMQDALEISRLQGYNVEPIGDYVLILTGNVRALGISWDEISIMADPVNGIKQIVLTRKNSETTEELKKTVFNELKSLYPKSKYTAYIESFSIPNGRNNENLTIQSDHANLFDLVDDKDEYSGSAYYILSRNEFSTIICKKHTKDW